MKQFTTTEQVNVDRILASLHELDSLYHSCSFAEYEQTWQAVEQQIQQTFPGFTLAYAELYTSSSERKAHGRMRHVLVPHSEPLANCELVC